MILVTRDGNKSMAADAAVVIAAAWRVGGTGYLAAIIDSHGKDHLQTALWNQGVQISHGAVLPQKCPPLKTGARCRNARHLAVGVNGKCPAAAIAVQMPQISRHTVCPEIGIG